MFLSHNISCFETFISCIHYKFSRMSFVLPFTFCRASQKARNIYFCATGHLMGRSLADDLISALLTVLLFVDD